MAKMVLTGPRDEQGDKAQRHRGEQATRDAGKKTVECRSSKATGQSTVQGEKEGSEAGQATRTFVQVGLQAMEGGVFGG